MMAKKKKKTAKRVRRPAPKKTVTNDYGTAVDAVEKELNELLTADMPMTEFTRRQVKFGERLMFVFAWRLTRLAATRL